MHRGYLMQIDISNNINDIIQALPEIQKRVVPKAVVPALNRGIQKSYSLATRYAARDFNRRLREIRSKKIVTKINAKRNDWSAVVYFNKYPETMTVDRFYTEADANNTNIAQPMPGFSVKGRAFTFTPTRGNSTSEIWAKRSTRRSRIDNNWNSSQLHILKHKRSVRDASRMASQYAREGYQVFIRRFLTHELPRQLRRAGF